MEALSLRHRWCPPVSTAAAAGVLSFTGHDKYVGFGTLTHVEVLHSKVADFRSIGLAGVTHFALLFLAAGCQQGYQKHPCQMSYIQVFHIVYSISPTVDHPPFPRQGLQVFYPALNNMQGKSRGYGLDFIGWTYSGLPADPVFLSGHNVWEKNRVRRAGGFAQEPVVLFQ